MAELSASNTLSLSAQYIEIACKLNSISHYGPQHPGKEFQEVLELIIKLLLHQQTTT